MFKKKKEDKLDAVYDFDNYRYMKHYTVGVLVSHFGHGNFLLIRTFLYNTIDF